MNTTYSAELFYVMVPGDSLVYGAFASSTAACAYAHSQGFIGYRVRDGVYLNYLKSEHTLKLVTLTNR